MIDNSSYITAAYVVTWLTVGAYFLHLRRVRREAEARYRDAERTTGGVS